MSEFDEFAKAYDVALEKGISLSGESKDYFAEGRVAWLFAKLGEHTRDVTSILDFGCGTGTSCPILKRWFPCARIVGVDPSRQSIEEARRTIIDDAISFEVPSDISLSTSFDLVFCNGVFHHIPGAERGEAIKWIWDHMRLGGIFSFWENNPLNIGTQLVMHRIPFDRNAEKILPWAAKKLLSRHGFRIENISYCFWFPSFLRWFRCWEPALSGICLGAQYQILAKKMYPNAFEVASMVWDI